MMRGISKFILKDSAIKKVVADHKKIDHAIDKIEALSTLAPPTKRRLRTLMTMQQLVNDNPNKSQSEPIEIGDNENPDLIFVL